MKNKSYKIVLAVIAMLVFNLYSCVQNSKKDESVTKTVTATAYNSTEAQTKKGNIGIAAWGDTLVPGEKSIAVSRDLIKQGLDHNTKVQIEGLEGTFIVKDKMNKRWEGKIDIYMGLDEKAAKEWGKQKVKITFDTIKQD